MNPPSPQTETTYKRIPGNETTLDVLGFDGELVSVQLPASDHLIVYLQTSLAEPGANFHHKNVLAKTVGLGTSQRGDSEDIPLSQRKPVVRTHLAIPTNRIEFGDQIGGALPIRIGGQECLLYPSVTEAKDGRPVRSFASSSQIVHLGFSRDLFYVAESATCRETFEGRGGKLNFSDPDAAFQHTLEHKLSMRKATSSDERKNVPLAEVLGFDRRTLTVTAPPRDPNAFPLSDVESSRPTVRTYQGGNDRIVWDGRSVKRWLVDRRLCDIELPDTDHLIVYTMHELEDRYLTHEHPNTLTKTLGLGTSTVRSSDGTLITREVPLIKTSFAIPVDKIHPSDFDKTGAYAYVSGAGEMKLLYPNPIAPGPNPHTKIPRACRLMGPETIHELKRLAEIATPRAKLKELGWTIDQIPLPPEKTQRISELLSRIEHPQKLMGLDSLDRCLVDIKPPRSVQKPPQVAKLLADLAAMEVDPAERDR